MTPETRAARDRIAKSIAAFDANPEAKQANGLTDMDKGVYIHAGVADLRTVLAALDQQPDGLIQFPHDMSGEDVERFRAEWDAARGPERALTLHADNRTATFRAKPWPDGPPDAAQLDYRAARREQHPTDSEDGWKPGDIR